MTVLGAGLALLFVGGERRFATAPDPLLGNVLAAGSAVAWAFRVTGYRWLARDRAADHGRPHGAVASAAACGNLIVFLVSLPWALPLARGRATDWLVVVYLGVFQLGLAYVFLSRAIVRVPRARGVAVPARRAGAVSRLGVARPRRDAGAPRGSGRGGDTY